MFSRSLPPNVNSHGLALFSEATHKADYSSTHGMWPEPPTRLVVLFFFPASEALLNCLPCSSQVYQVPKIPALPALPYSPGSIRLGSDMSQ